MRHQVLAEAGVLSARRGINTGANWPMSKGENS